MHINRSFFVCEHFSGTHPLLEWNYFTWHRETHTQWASQQSGKDGIHPGFHAHFTFFLGVGTLFFSAQAHSFLNYFFLIPKSVASGILSVWHCKSTYFVHIRFGHSVRHHPPPSLFSSIFFWRGAALSGWVVLSRGLVDDGVEWMDGGKWCRSTGTGWHHLLVE